MRGSESANILSGLRLPRPHKSVPLFLHARRGFIPAVSLDSQIVSGLEQLAHLVRVEFFLVRGVEASRDLNKIEIDTIPLSLRIDLV